MLTLTAETEGKPSDELLIHQEFLDRCTSKTLEAEIQSELGQHFTPGDIAAYMSSLVSPSDEMRILDPGAGTGMLSYALVHHLAGQAKVITLTAYEVDTNLCHRIETSFIELQSYCKNKGTKLTYEVIPADFIEKAAVHLNDSLYVEETKYDVIISNPPYKKINSQSQHRKVLRGIGIETSNLYSAFIWLSLLQLKDRGQMIFICPRSFANGPYFRPLREVMVDTLRFSSIRVFESRSDSFDNVLQENVIFHAIKSETPATSQTVLVSASEQINDPPTTYSVSHHHLVSPDDPDLFIHIHPSLLEFQISEAMRVFTHSLDDIGVKVSTGRVVDFRSKEWISHDHIDDAVPLIYPTHFSPSGIQWPKSGKKPNYYRHTPESSKWLVPAGNYVLTKRFSTKEEVRRIVATVIKAEAVPAEHYAIENHINYFHSFGSPLEENLANGLCAFLNSTMVDKYFRQFNGHTQVNATDLRNFRYPSKEELEAMGQELTGDPTREQIDSYLSDTFFTLHQKTLMSEKKIEEALEILKALCVPKAQQNQRSALTLLALINLSPTDSWADATIIFRGITQIMDFIRDEYSVEYAPNTRETIRRQTMHQFVDLGMAIPNPDDPNRAVNSPKFGYEIEPNLLVALQSFTTNDWDRGGWPKRSQK